MGRIRIDTTRTLAIDVKPWQQGRGSSVEQTTAVAMPAVCQMSLGHPAHWWGKSDKTPPAVTCWVFVFVFAEQLDKTWAFLLGQRSERRVFVELEGAAALTSFGVCIEKRDREDVGLPALIISVEEMLAKSKDISQVTYLRVLQSESITGSE